MFVFIWKGVDNLTPNYHPEGDLSDIAKDLDRARELLRERTTGNWPDLLPASDVSSTEPTYTIPAASGWEGELVIISPDAGCC